MKQLATNNGDFDIATEQTVLTYALSSSPDAYDLKAEIRAGDGTNNLSGGDTYTIRGYINDDGTDVLVFESDVVVPAGITRRIFDVEFFAQGGETVKLTLQNNSGNAETVDITTYLYTDVTDDILEDTSDMQPRFTGITSLANWLRGLFRKDAMDATAKAEINADGGTYNEATDSQEALGEMTLAAAGTGTLFNKLGESITVTTGNAAGDITDMEAPDDSYYQVEPVDNEIDFYVEFDLGDKGVPSQVVFGMAGSTSHHRPRRLSMSMLTTGLKATGTR